MSEMTTMKPPTAACVRSLIDRNPGQGTFEEYMRVLEVIRARAPAKVLVFGVGKDSQLWSRANQGGRTVFVEHEAEWIARTREQVSEAEFVQVRYGTARWQWPLLLHLPWLLRMRDLPASVVDERWDVIFVDSPQGGHAQRPGRMMSLVTASLLARRSPRVDVLAHDCDRRVERVYCDRYFADFERVTQIHTLRHYRKRARAEES
jgi:hypothetical protein